jgi:transposase
MTLSEQEQIALQALVGPGGYDGSVASRARIVLLFGEGTKKTEIARLTGATRPTIDKWLKRYADHGIDGLVSEKAPGAPRQIPARIRSRIFALTRMSPPRELGISHWSSAEMAGYIKLTEGVYVSQTWVSRLWRENGLRPWKQGTFKISKDPDFEEKVRDVVDLYLNPPEGDVVVSADAKTGIQALDRTQPMLPVDFNKAEKRTHDYKRHGTLDMYAAMDMLTGRVQTVLSSTHNSTDFLRLMGKVVAANPGKRIHVILDNASTHDSEETRKWLARQNGKIVFHFTPKGASWMNAIEIWNGIITRKSIRRGSHTSTRALRFAIKSFVDHWNANPTVIKWTATADEIIQKVRAISSSVAGFERATEIGDVSLLAA